MASINWSSFTNNGQATYWNFANNWQGGKLPGSSDTAILSDATSGNGNPTQYFVNILSSEIDSVGTLSIGSSSPAGKTRLGGLNIAGSLTTGGLIYTGTTEVPITINSGGLLNITSSITNSTAGIVGETITVNGGTAELGSSISPSGGLASVTFSFSGSSADTLVLDSTALSPVKVTGMDLDDRIEVKGQDFTGDHVTYEGTTLTVLDSSNTVVFTMDNVTAAAGSTFATSGDTITDVTCFVAGTHILTANGEKTVETLAPGDLIVTLVDGARCARSVRWIGRRQINVATHPRPQAVAPIRIRAGAFAENVPHRDLLVSPDHAICADGKLIVARQLINGATIRQDDGWKSVEYFHVELDSHAILLAEGLPAESYLDTGNRGFFANTDAPLLLHPDLTDEADYPTREAGSCYPFVWDEASVRPIWQQLTERAVRLGYALAAPETTADLNLRIAVEGRVLTPVHTAEGSHVFVLPKGVTEVRVLSQAGRPTDAKPWLEDRRVLGASVERIVLRSSDAVHEVPMDHPALSGGWWAIENEGSTLRRWTNGDAVLPLPKTVRPATLELRASNGGMAYVVEKPLRATA